MLVQQEMSDIIDSHMMSYSAEVLLQRAIPILQDGMKPVQRRILFTLYNSKVTRLTKSASITGEVTKIHPHGSSYGALVNMTQKDRNQVPLVTGHGSFGQFNSSELDASAERYTEVKISDFGKDMTKQIGDKVVNFSKSYDGLLDLPDVIPVSFPLILLYAQSGIGVGYASSTLSYNMNEIADAISNYIKNEETPILYPDFATGGYIIEDEDALENNTLTGRSTFTLRAKINKVDNNTLSIVEMPYGVKREAIIDKIISLYQTGKLPELKTIKDLSDFKGENIQIKTKKANVDLDVLIEKLYKLTPLESTISSNSNIIDYSVGLPKVMGVEEIIKKWLEWRVSVVRVGIDRDIEKLTKTAMLYQGLGKVLNRVDDLIEIIRHSQKAHLHEIVKTAFNLNDEQTDYVLNIKLYNINDEFIQDRINEIPEIEKNLQDKKDSSTDDNILKMIDEEIQSLKKKYGYDRKTKIIKKPRVSKTLARKVANNLKNEVNIIMTEKGYLFKNTTESRITLLPSDSIVKNIKIDDSEKLQVIASDGNIYGIDIKKIPENVNKLGTYSLSLSNRSIDAEALLIISSQDEQVVYGYENGKANVWPTSTLNFTKTITKNAFATDSKLIFASASSDNEKVGVKNEKQWDIFKVKDLKHSNSKTSKGSYTLTNHKLNVVFDKGEK